MEIRPARPEDAPAIAALYYASWRRTYGPLVSEAIWQDFTPHSTAAEWRNNLRTAKPGITVLVAEDCAGLAGFLYAFPDPDDPARDVLESLHVAADRQGAGIGRELMAAYACELARRNRPRVVLHVIEGNRRAIDIYTHLGGETGVRKIHRSYGFDIPMIPVAWNDFTRLCNGPRPARQRTER